MYFQIGRSKELLNIDAKTSAVIKLRYKDTAKYVIWPDCPLPANYNRECLVSTYSGLLKLFNSLFL